jgi:aminoglycoside/choline kinase family phosphotransferase
LYDCDLSAGIFLFDDFGDGALQDVNSRVDAGERTRLYRSAIDEMLKIQVVGTALRRDCVAFHRYFDVEKLMYEMDFFLEHTVKGFFKASMDEEKERALRKRLESLCGYIAALPPVLNHRDFHSRNLMVTDRRLGVIDFQDARMGPCQYDLVSLLKDSYVTLDDALRRELTEYYLFRSAAAGFEWYDKKEFMRNLDLVGLQRNLKACGTFGFMATVRGNDRYVSCLAPTFRYVTECAVRYPLAGEIVELLAPCVPPLREGDCGTAGNTII